MRRVVLDLTAHFDVSLEQNAEEHLLAIYRAYRNGNLPDAPAGFVNASAKLYDDASRALILHTIMGETLSLIISEEIKNFYPAPGRGFHFKPLRIEYQETPEKLDPPANSVPMLISVGNRTKH